MIYWKKVEDEFLTDVYYSLQLENGNEIAYLWYDAILKKWFLSPTMFKEYVRKQSYNKYGISDKDVNEVQFKALLDLQEDYNKVVYTCNNVSEELGSLITRCLQKEVYANENP